MRSLRLLLAVILAFALGAGAAVLTYSGLHEPPATAVEPIDVGARRTSGDERNRGDEGKRCKRKPGQNRNRNRNGNPGGDCPSTPPSTGADPVAPAAPVPARDDDRDDDDRDDDGDDD